MSTPKICDTCGAVQGEADGSASGKAKRGWRKVSPVAGWICAGAIGVALGRMHMPPRATAGDASSDAVRPPTAPSRAPSFAEVQGKLDKHREKLTQVQMEVYLEAIMGSRVKWRGKVTDVNGFDPGSLSMRCSAPVGTANVTVTLDGTQQAKLARINKGQVVIVEGQLVGYDSTGAAYRINLTPNSSAGTEISFRFGGDDGPMSGLGYGSRYEIVNARVVGL